MQHTIAITGGGTGGHLSIAKALGIACKAQGINTLYIGGTRGQDKEWFYGGNIFDNMFFLDSVPVVNQRGLNKFKALGKNIIQAKKAKKIMQDLNTSACISVGGFCAASGGFGSLIGGIPLFIHEQNAFIGSLNKLLKPFCNLFFSSFTFNNSIITPYPVNEIFFDKQRVRKNLNFILFLGGSQGAKAINDLALALAISCHEKGIKIIHQTGKADYKRVQTEYQKLGFSTKMPDIELNQNSSKESKMQDYISKANNETKLKKEVILFDFSSELANIISISDFCISRAGASSLWELTSNGLPTLFIPYPYAAKNHQYFNAKFLSDKDLAILYVEEQIKECYRNNDLTQKLLEEIISYPLEQCSKNLINHAKRDGAKEIINRVIQDINN
ncbi:UDP-N-acetylglucosamine--N-acetylmuramyl-(pentapeptide) pyrophosphoryl-undecaprenol N-acetylglucosamine transferase [Helicobacter muridarum]|uniref:UDP-N-acetylglucosamine--N-acetylmuramyl-(pentapeptide) pyrophosphoryl-undecaprenol N-acetylglucosamine transferase n=1 Tax=Helicobacter muridarum TaxID=216 RepID=A0A099TWR3_9HELI|nr:UDP-N-acetylglucosamine--N-acetylmuramyl-(pentapeptide) pyrophosphoryl-undecaprenol N-acetylglucosamine transferase [Helicobacter muridarum]TLE00206.1 UDP-N-acetylglucosamine--N-acetylmuramyl-(pentapeptide) pyrophosphoryl-undecaprenol N-acetylglucosamine transferase [Helicobacter muridarum]STQ85690.1 N-acetylglucosaminyl transferase [Helicobacter muridarum]